jgi:hypothetical protein
MSYSLDLRIEEAKTPLSLEKRARSPSICDISFETAAATTMYLAEILELHDKTPCQFTMIAWNGPNPWGAGHDEWILSTPHLKMHRNRDCSFDSDHEEQICHADEVTISGFGRQQRVRWNGEALARSNPMPISSDGIDQKREEQILALTRMYFRRSSRRTDAASGGAESDHQGCAPTQSQHPHRTSRLRRTRRPC